MHCPRESQSTCAGERQPQFENSGATVNNMWAFEGNVNRSSHLSDSVCVSARPNRFRCCTCLQNELRRKIFHATISCGIDRMKHPKNDAIMGEMKREARREIKQNARPVAHAATGLANPCNGDQCLRNGWSLSSQDSTNASTTTQAADRYTVCSAPEKACR